MAGTSLDKRFLDPAYILASDWKDLSARSVQGQMAAMSFV